MFKTLKYYFLVCTLFCHYSSSSQNPQLQNNLAIDQSFKQLQTGISVLYIAAHPDDENTQLLSYLSQVKHYRTGYLSLTRGDGGQNLIGAEQGIALGILRTHELLEELTVIKQRELNIMLREKIPVPFVQSHHPYVLSLSQPLFSKKHAL